MDGCLGTYVLNVVQVIETISNNKDLADFSQRKESIPNLLRENLLVTLTNDYETDLKLSFACTDKSSVFAYSTTGSVTAYSKPESISCGDSFTIPMKKAGFLLLMVKSGKSQTFTLSASKPTTSSKVLIIAIVAGVVFLLLVGGVCCFRKHRDAKLRSQLH